MLTSANCPKSPGDVRADVGIRAPVLPLSQQPLTSFPSKPVGRDLAFQEFLLKLLKCVLLCKAVRRLGK